MNEVIQLTFKLLFKIVYLFLRAHFVYLSVLSSYGVPERKGLLYKIRNERVYTNKLFGNISTLHHKCKNIQ